MVRGLEICGEAQSVTARGSDGVAGEQTAEIDDVENVGQILSVDLKTHVQPLGFIDIGARRSIHLERRINAAAREINAIQNLLAILREHGRRIAIELKGQPGIVLNSRSDPEPRLHLITQAPANGIALILRIRESAR